jgi:hypothetical protein
MDENIGRNFSPWNIYDCHSATKEAIDKWVVQTDSAHQRGPETTFQEVLIVVQSGGGGGYKNARNLRKSPPTFIVVQQPEEQWTNGDDSAIQRIKEV